VATRKTQANSLDAVAEATLHITFSGLAQLSVSLCVEKLRQTRVTCWHGKFSRMFN